MSTEQLAAGPRPRLTITSRRAAGLSAAAGALLGAGLITLATSPFARACQGDFCDPDLTSTTSGFGPVSFTTTTDPDDALFTSTQDFSAPSFDDFVSTGPVGTEDQITTPFLDAAVFAPPNPIFSQIPPQPIFEFVPPDSQAPPSPIFEFPPNPIFTDVLSAGPVGTEDQIATPFFDAAFFVPSAPDFGALSPVFDLLPFFSSL
jgi:hypothetical protein